MTPGADDGEPPAKVARTRPSDERPDVVIPPGKALGFKVDGQCGRARAGIMRLPHGLVHTPVFMPVGTQGTIKGLTSEQVQALGAEIILGNTYHLANRPGTEVFDEIGGLHKFEAWPRNLLTDSGGYQMVSLCKLAVFTEEGVEFENPHDQSRMLLTPEKSIQYQNSIGADIIMALDDVVSSTLIDDARIELATHRTHRWIDRCIKAHARPTEQNLFGIVQGHLNRELRALSLKEMIARDLPGYAIGGLSGGEKKADFWPVVKQCTDDDGGLPVNKPRYLMGVGYALDLVVCVALGVDMFDCVYPSRTARFGTALVRKGGTLRITQAKFARDFEPVEAGCPCLACTRYTRAYLHVIATREAVGSSLLTMHNITYQLRLMQEMRREILAGTFPEFVKRFVVEHLDGKPGPTWARDALLGAGIDVSGLADWSVEGETSTGPVVPQVAPTV